MIHNTLKWLAGGLSSKEELLFVLDIGSTKLGSLFRVIKTIIGDDTPGHSLHRKLIQNINPKLQ